MCLGVPGKVIEIREEHGTAWPASTSAASRKEVCLAYVPECASGDYVIVHVGFAITRLDEASALETLAISTSSACSSESRRAGRRVAGAGQCVKYLDEYQRRRWPARCSPRSADRHAAVGDHGGLRRPDALDHPQRHRPAAARPRSSWSTGRAARCASRRWR